MVRPAEEEDAVRVAAIYNHYVEKTTVTFEEKPVPPALMAERIREIRAIFPFLVRESTRGEIVAFAYASAWKSRCAYRFTAETTVYVASEATGQGHGAAIYAALLEVLRGRSLHSLLGGIALPNAASIALHEKLGFQKVAHLKEVGWKFNRWIDVGYWELLL